MKNILKKAGVICASLLVCSSLGRVITKAEEVEENIPTAADLFAKYYNNGKYIKETEIKINEEAQQELVKYFHNGANQLKRTTYFEGEQLWMTGEGINSGYGTDAEGNMTHFTRTSTGDVVDYTVKVGEGDWHNPEIKGMEGYYVTLHDLLDTPNDIWEYKDGTYKTYNATMLDYFRLITAPCFLNFNKENANYFTFRKAEMKEVSDGKLCLSLYIEETNSGVLLNSESNLFSEAFITFPKDYSDDFVNGYNAEVSFDKEINHDGKQSLKITPQDAYFEVKSYAEKDLRGYAISFYIKTTVVEGKSNKFAVVAYGKTDDIETEQYIYLDVPTKNPSEITVSPADANGWYKVTVDCELFSQEYTSKINIKGSTIYTTNIWIDELSYAFDPITKPTEPVEPETPVTPEVIDNDLSDKMVGSDTGTVSLDNDVSYDDIQSMKITGVPSYAEEGSNSYKYSIAFYKGSYDFVEDTKISFYAKLDENIYSHRIAFRIETTKGTKLTNNITVSKASPIAGVTCTVLEDGWYHVVINVSEFKDQDEKNSNLSVVGEQLKYLRFGFLADDRGPNAEKIPTIWIDQLTIK